MPHADTNAVAFPVGDSQRVGVYYAADTDQPAPFALFLHGIPGSEKNHDLAQALRAQGWHALVLHFGGAWGSGGDYTIAQHPADASAALDAMLARPAPRIDPQRVAVIGYSLGSRAALLAAQSDPRFGAVVSLAGISDFSETLFEEAFFTGFEPFLRGGTPASLTAQFRALGHGQQPYEAVGQLAPRPVLVVHGTDDEVVPSYHADALAYGQAHVRLIRMEGANHTFASQRLRLIAEVSTFLEGWRNGR
jgi:hypothetical protein